MANKINNRAKQPIQGSGPTLEDLRNQSGSAALMQRSLGLNSQRPMTPPMVNQGPQANIARTPPQQGSGQQGSFYAEGSGQPGQGHFYAGSGNWWSNRGPQTQPITNQPNRGVGNQTPPTVAGQPTSGYGGPRLGNVGPGQTPTVSSGPQPGSGSATGGHNWGGGPRQTNTTLLPQGFATGAPTAQRTRTQQTTDAQNDPHSEANTAHISTFGETTRASTSAETTPEEQAAAEEAERRARSGQGPSSVNPNDTSVQGPDGSTWGSLQQLADQYGLDIDTLAQLVSEGHGLQVTDNEGEIWVSDPGGAGGGYWLSSQYGGQQKNQADRTVISDGSTVEGANKESALDKWLRENKPPQFDESELASTNTATRANFARQKAAALRASAEAGAYGGAGADQMAAAIGNTGIGYGLAAETEVARNQLQLKVQNHQAQVDYYNKGFAAAMQDFQATQNQQSFENAMKMAAQSAQLQKDLIKYQQELADQISPADVFGGILGLGTSLGSAYIGGKFGSGAW